MEDRCLACGFDATDASMAVVVAGLADTSAKVTTVLSCGAEPDVRRRPATEVWSPIEYIGHLRESMAFHRWLIELGLSQHEPSIPAVDPDASVAAAGYAEARTDDVVAQFVRRVDRLSSLLTDLTPDSLDRRVHLDGRTITIGLVARSAWHECSHHLLDIRDLLDISGEAASLG